MLLCEYDIIIMLLLVESTIMFIVVTDASYWISYLFLFLSQGVLCFSFRVCIVCHTNLINSS